MFYIIFGYFKCFKETEFHRKIFACIQYTLKNVAYYTAFHQIALEHMMFFTYNTRYSIL